jgi:hypothetical protein
VRITKRKADVSIQHLTDLVVLTYAASRWCRSSPTPSVVGLLLAIRSITCLVMLTITWNHPGDHKKSLPLCKKVMSELHSSTSYLASLSSFNPFPSLLSIHPIHFNILFLEYVLLLYLLRVLFCVNGVWCVPGLQLN